MFDIASRKNSMAKVSSRRAGAGDSDSDLQLCHRHVQHFLLFASPSDSLLSALSMTAASCSLGHVLMLSFLLSCEGFNLEAASYVP